jgi:DNA polymerase III subunit delta
MLIFVYGDDTFRSQEKVRELEAAFKKKFDPTAMNLSTFAGKLDVGEVLQAVASAPFLAPKRMTVVRGLIENVTKGDQKTWEEGLAKVPDSAIVVLWETEGVKATEKSALYKSLSSGADVHRYPFPALEGFALSKWTAARMKALGGNIEPRALADLVSRVGPDLWQLSGEIEKLRAYAGGKTIDGAMVRQLVRSSFEGEIFAFLDAVSGKRPAEAMRLLDEERQAEASDFYLFIMLAREIRILLSIRSAVDENPRATQAGLAAETGLNPFVVGKAMNAARRYATEDLIKAHDLLFERDRASKDGGMDASLAVDLTVQDLLR